MNVDVAPWQDGFVVVWAEKRGAATHCDIWARVFRLNALALNGVGVEAVTTERQACPRALRFASLGPLCGRRGITHPLDAAPYANFSQGKCFHSPRRPHRTWSGTPASPRYYTSDQQTLALTVQEQEHMQPHMCVHTHASSLAQ